MKRTTPLFLLIASALFWSTGCTLESNQSLSLDPEVTIQDLHTGYQQERFTAEQVVQFYLDRIAALDDEGPELNAVIGTNPKAQNKARELDSIYAATGNLVGPLHGIPVLLKDNIDVKGMATTVGSNALLDNVPSTSSPLAQQLENAGAIILGKANLSELANFHSTHSSSGWSPVGGQCKNPYDLTRNPCGSSSGSGASVAANFCVLAIGTETNGSITCPANNNGIVGIKPTVGLISRTGIFPISSTQDTGGPMARSVKDAAIALGTMVASDPLDAKTLQPGRQAETDYTAYLDDRALEGTRIGYYKQAMNDHFLLQEAMDNALQALEDQGATVVLIDEAIGDDATNPSYEVMFYEYRQGVQSYFASNPSSGLKSMSDLIASIKTDSMEMAFHDHALLDISDTYTPELKDSAYQAALEEARRRSQDEGIDRMLTTYNLDAIVGPAGGPAWKTDIINGDHFGVYSGNASAIAGYPHIVVPMASIHGLPVGLSILGGKWSEGALIGYAYDFEQAVGARFTPTFRNGSVEE